MSRAECRDTPEFVALQRGIESDWSRLEFHRAGWTEAWTSIQDRLASVNKAFPLPDDYEWIQVHGYIEQGLAVMESSKVTASEKTE